MEASDYEFLVRRLENQALSSPRAFQAKVVVLSGVAYLVLALALGLLAGLGYLGFVLARDGHLGWVAIKLGIIGLAMAGLMLGVLRTFLAPLPPPEGREITAAEAPRLFEMLERIRYKLGGPPLHRVVIDSGFNAAIAQVPRFGLFGGHKNHLIVGLPYLFGVSTNEMAATLAHEYGHLTDAHGKLSSWIYRQRITFDALLDKLRRKGTDDFVNRLLLGALERFAPYFNAYTFVLSRQNEYDADSASVRVVGADVAASCLCRDVLLGEWFAGTFWPRLYAQARQHPAPLFMPFSAMPKAFAASYPEWATSRNLQKATRVRSGLDDTHPCLLDRLSAIGRNAQVPPPLTRSAADTLLGPLAATLAKEFDAAWWRDEQAGWLAHHRRCEENRAAIARMAPIPAEKLNPVELQELARALYEEQHRDEARVVLRHLLARPGGPFPRAELLLGRVLLKERDDAGLDHLRKAAVADRRLTEECARRGYDYLSRERSEDEAAAWASDLWQAQGA